MVSDDIRMIEEVLDNNRENIPENDRITSLNALMRINNNNSSNQGSANTTTGYESTIVVTMNEIGVGHFNFQNRLLPDNGNISKGYCYTYIYFRMDAQTSRTKESKWFLSC